MQIADTESSLIRKKAIITGKQKDTLPEYRENKIIIMQRDFMVELTPEEINRINQLNSVSAIDRYCRRILQKRWKVDDIEE